MFHAIFKAEKKPHFIQILQNSKSYVLYNFDNWKSHVFTIFKTEKTPCFI